MNVRKYSCMLQDVVHMEVTDPWMREGTDTETEKRGCVYVSPTINTE